MRLSRALRWLFNEEDLETTRAREKGAKLDVQSIKEKKTIKIAKNKYTNLEKEGIFGIHFIFDCFNFKMKSMK